MRTKSDLIRSTGSGALVNILANIILLPIMNSYWGAAWATLVSYFTMALTIYLVSNKIYPIAIEWKRLAKITVLIIPLMILYYVLPLSVLVRIILLLGAIVLSYFGVLNKNERQIIKVRIAGIKST